MKTTLMTNITANEICDGFIYNELEGKGLSIKETTYMPKRVVGERRL